MTAPVHGLSTESLLGTVRPLRFWRAHDDGDGGEIAQLAQVGGVSLFIQRATAAPSSMLLAYILSLHRGSPASTFAIVRSAHGEPMTVTGEPAPAFSLSRAEGWRGVAVADRGRVGMDMETVARVAENARADDAWLSTGDRHAVSAVPERHRAGEIACRWVLKEAYGKMRGVGLALPLDRITFGARDGRIMARADDPDDAASLGRCTMRLACRGPLLIGIVRQDRAAII